MSANICDKWHSNVDHNLSLKYYWQMFDLMKKELHRQKKLKLETRVTSFCFHSLVRFELKTSRSFCNTHHLSLLRNDNF